MSVQASASGYNPASKTTTFEVVAKNDNITLPIANNTIVNDTTRVIVNETGFNGNETGPSEGEQGDAGSNNGNVTLLPPPDPCIENPSLPECISATVLPSIPIADPCIENPSLPECTLHELPPPPPPPPIDPCEQDPTAEGCEDPEPIPELGDGDAGEDDGDDGDDGGDGGGDTGGDEGEE